jgi:hypothetical protein
MAKTKNLSETLAELKTWRQEQPNEIGADRRIFLQEAMLNIHPLLEMDTLDVRESLRVLEDSSKNEVMVQIVTNKNGDRGFYIDKEGLFALATATSKPKRIDADFKYRGFLSEEIMDDLAFVHPKWLAASDVKKYVAQAEQKIAEMLTTFMKNQKIVTPKPIVSKDNDNEKK